MTAAGAPFPGADELSHGALQTSGLPARMLAVLRTSGLTTLGDLARPLPACERLDAGDRALLARVAAYANSACAGRPSPLNLLEWLGVFLTPRLADTIQLHYGLKESSSAIARHEARLRETGFKLSVSRERARQ